MTEYAYQLLYGPPWRWRAAKCIARLLTRMPEYMESRPLEEEDPTVQAIVALRQHKTCGSGIDHINPQWISALQEARLTHRDSAKRLTTEAFILAGEDTAEIGKRIGLRATTVAEFERCFFDVRRKLGSRDFILDRVIDGRSDLNLLERQLLRHAYLGSVVAAKHWMAHLEYLGTGIDHDLGTAEGRDRERLDLLLLHESIDPAAVPAHVLALLFEEAHQARPLPTVSELMHEQLQNGASRLLVSARMTQPAAPLLDPFASVEMYHYIA